MNPTYSIWLVLVVAFVAANLPFVNNRWMLVGPRRDAKSLLVRVVELLVWYVLVGGFGLALEQHAGQIYPQGWEFYAVTASLFLTFAFPGFVYRYLVRRRA